MDTPATPTPDRARLTAEGIVTPDVGGRALPTTLTAAFPFERLDRWPLHGARERQAHDAADVLLLDTLAGWLADGREPGPVAVLHDQHGALALPLLAAGMDVRLGVDEASAARSIAHNLDRLSDAAGAPPAGWGTLRIGGVDAATLDGVRTVLLTLPRSLDALHLSAARVAAHADPEVLVLGAGRDKHMTPSMNEVLARSFGAVLAGRGRSKSRVLTAARPLPGAAEPKPRTRAHRVPGLGEVVLVGGWATFGGAQADPGSRLLARTLAQEAPALPLPRGRRLRTDSGLSVDVPWTAPADAPADVVDAGSGNGLLSVAAARVWPKARVLASDQSADAVASSAATAAANGLEDRITAVQDDALSAVPDASVRAVLLNPPFHDATAVDPSVAHRMIEESGRVLAPGGELWCVWNSHLRHRPVLESAVGPTRQAARDRTFTVTVSTRR